MAFLGILREKPWQVGPSNAELAVPRPKRIALRFFLAMVTVLFSLFIVTFLARSQFPDFEALAAQPWQPFYNASQLWWNTGLLLMASICLQLAFIFGRVSKRHLAVALVGLAALFTLAFLLAQWSVWQQLQALGYYVATNPANSYFYLLTALHGIHLLGGLAVVIALLIRASSDINNDKFVASIGLSATYCHYLFLVWLVLFALLTSTPETYKTLAGLCGF